MNVVTPHREQLRPEWLDAYGHLNEGYYLVAFSNAAWDFLDKLEVGVAYFERTGCGMYTAESHLRFLKEVRAPAVLETQGVILGLDAKRVRCGFIMTSGGEERATLETVYIHFDTKAGRAVAMSDEVQARLRAAQTAALPPWAGRGITLERR